MYFALGAAANTAADLLSSLVPGKSSTSKATTGITQNTTTSFDISSTTITSANALPSSGSTGQSGALSPQTLSALFAAQDPSQSSASTSKSDALKNLFGLLDTNGDGQISKSEFEDKLGAGGTNVANADSVFGKLDANGDGSVSLDELTQALTATKKGGGHHHAHGAGGKGGGKGGEDELLKALDGASGNSTTNSDGSTSTTVTYADGSTVTMTTPAASKSSSSSSASSSYNLVEQMIQKQANALALSAKQSLSVSV
jgi:EF-hand domain pair